MQREFRSRPHSWLIAKVTWNFIVIVLYDALSMITSQSHQPLASQVIFPPCAGAHESTVVRLHMN